MRESARQMSGLVEKQWEEVLQELKLRLHAVHGEDHGEVQGGPQGSRDSPAAKEGTDLVLVLVDA